MPCCAFGGGGCLKSDPACLFMSDTPEGQHLRIVDSCLCDPTATLTDAVHFTGGHQTVVIMIVDRSLMIREDVLGRAASVTHARTKHVERVVKCDGKCCNSGSCVLVWAGWNMKTGFMCIV